jgi:hypothetical protein
MQQIIMTVLRELEIFKVRDIIESSLMDILRKRLDLEIREQYNSGQRVIPFCMEFLDTKFGLILDTIYAENSSIFL